MGEFTAEPATRPADGAEVDASIEELKNLHPNLYPGLEAAQAEVVHPLEEH